jgi:hypothetical protein
MERRPLPRLVLCIGLCVCLALSLSSLPQWQIGDLTAIAQRSHQSPNGKMRKAKVAFSGKVPALGQFRFLPRPLPEKPSGD